MINVDECTATIIANHSMTVSLAERLTTIDTRSVHTTPQECRLLLALLRTKGKVCSVEKLLEKINAKQKNGPTVHSTLKAVLCKLRAKLDPLFDGEEYIKSIGGIGYLIPRGDAPNAETDPSLTALFLRHYLPGVDDRWSRGRKLALVSAIANGKVSQEQALQYYPYLSTDVLDEWRLKFGIHLLEVRRHAQCV